MPLNRTTHLAPQTKDPTQGLTTIGNHSALYSQDQMAREINFDATSPPEGKASKAVVRAARNAGRTDSPLAHSTVTRSEASLNLRIFCDQTWIGGLPINMI